LSHFGKELAAAQKSQTGMTKLTDEKAQESRKPWERDREKKQRRDYFSLPR
jgi:hypothetical protein